MALWAAACRTSLMPDIPVPPRQSPLTPRHPPTRLWCEGVPTEARRPCHTPFPAPHLHSCTPAARRPPPLPGSNTPSATLPGGLGDPPRNAPQGNARDDRRVRERGATVAVHDLHAGGRQQLARGRGVHRVARRPDGPPKPHNGRVLHGPPGLPVLLRRPGGPHLRHHRRPPGHRALLPDAPHPGRSRPRCVLGRTASTLLAKPRGHRRTTAMSRPPRTIR